MSLKVCGFSVDWTNGIAVVLQGPEGSNPVHLSFDDETAAALAKWLAAAASGGESRGSSTRG